MDTIALPVEPEDTLPIEPTKKISVDSGVSPGVIYTLTPLGEDGVDGFTTREAKLLQIYYRKLLIAMEPEILDLSAKLFSNEKIGQETKYRVLDCLNTPSRDKCAIVLKDIESSVLIEPQFMPDLLSFFDLEGPDILKQLSRDMRSTLESMPPVPPSHSISAPFPRPRERLCLKPFASSPAGFAPELSSMCEHCEFQNRALSTMFEKFCQDYLKASLNLTETEEPHDNHHSFGTDLQIERDSPTTCSHNTLQESLDSELIKASTPSGSSGPKSLESSLFKPAPQSMDRQCSYDSVGNDEYFTRLTNDFLEKLKLFHHKQKQSKKKAISEKKVMSEKLERTEEEFKEMATQRSATEQELFDTKEEISVLKKSLEDAQARQTELAKDLLQYRQQLRNEKCVNGSSMDCKHFTRCSSLETDNVSLKRQVKNLEKYCTEYKAKIEVLELQISILLGNVQLY